MLRATLCCVLTAAMAAVALPWPWLPLEPTPACCPVGHDARITYAASYICGVFPNAGGPLDPRTYVAFFPISGQDPTNNHWSTPEEVPVPQAPYFLLYHTGLTFQWAQQGGQPDVNLYLIGDDALGHARLMWRRPQPGYSWSYYDINEFSLGDGACIAYAPNPGYHPPHDLIVGWIYCLPGNGIQFWRYSIPPSSYTAEAGIFPPDGSIIADQTPLFQWNAAPPGQYRLQVSTDELFSTTVIDEVVYEPEYQTTSELANDTYYWRVGTPNGLDWLWGDTYSFVLEGGFKRLDDDIPYAVADGAAMAYEADPWCWLEPSIIALVGGGESYFYRYDMAAPGWSTLYPAPKPENPGTSLTTNDPTGQYGQWPAAAFGGSTINDRPWSCNTSTGWFEYPAADFDPFPQPLGPGACFVQGLRPYAYLTTGEQDDNPTHYFYAIEPKHIKEPHGGGSQTGDTRTGSVLARVITSCDGIEVEYQLPAATHVRATLHDAVGRQVGILDVGSQQPGTHRLSWNRNGNGSKLSSGAYFLLLDMGKEQVRLKAVAK